MQETRSYKLTNIEIRDGTDGRTITGYPVVFDKPSQNLGGFIEYVDKTAFKDVSFDNVYLLYGHEFNNVLARVDAGTLTISVDDTGVFFSATLPNTTLANDVIENIRVGNIQGMSFGFTVADERWQTDVAVAVRTILKIDELFEITLTPIPAYQDTKVAISQRDRAQRSSELELIELNAIVRELEGD
ncbi:Peptidase U35, phage prohead HK97:Phage major capsid protein, HK97 [Leuconostoc gelidum subsp. gasicomitatum]|uniref:Peptidase U35, phage prohead HK97:Phage major capsid protein, HK97 n=1 Tax=Leuconostoc gasicomitatum TaxID=115778 RepID=A0ABP2B7L2_9LACO|nr:HK97 family phage prohead protease [Leuconostoc gasicomitatum]CUR63450.1 Phage prohead protease, HK97 family [Leuconostoc gasicomitatum KG16-1]CUW10509.1 Peptidase U35, phage prohead HK97:Phage major capsid protein, HK97 [Leuconostoc gasicomitatum]